MTSVNGLEEGKAGEITETEKVLPVSTNLKIESVSYNGDPFSQSLRAVTVYDPKASEHEITADNGGEDDGHKVTMETRKLSLGSFPLPWVAKKSERARVYHVWPGNNVFFIRGGLICGPDPKGFFVTSVSIILSTWVFCAFVADYFHNRSGLIIAFCVTLALIVFVNLILASSIDPGIIPRNGKWQLEETGARDTSLKRSKRVRILNGVEVKLKLCRICGLTCFHMYLIIKNQTAYENHKRCYVDSPNPYNKGALSNIKEVFFVRLQPSRVNFRAEVMPDQKGAVSQG
ncbi:hypothetical protein Syun_010069 [Stephania yunnanensis]|uniref:Protein S-acyltransferase n=1 Tax=Stephania yunnanensis TaxID=152371 RepID=A0AAP0KGU5_9MAGN